MTRSDRDTPRWGWGALAALLVFAFLVRLFLATNHPVIDDEYQWASIIDTVHLGPSGFHLPIHGDQHPPGQVYWATPGTWLLGTTILGYRLTSVLFGTLAVFLVFLVGRRLGGDACGLLAAALLAMNEYHCFVSSTCTEKTYLTFALLSLVAYAPAVREPSFRRVALLGAALGLGAFTKQAMILWAAPLLAGILLAHRDRWRLVLPRVLVGGAVFACFLVPDVLWNLTADLGTDDTRARGVAFQSQRLSIGTFSWGPLALYVRPLFYHRIERALSEYASMTTAPGLILLVPALLSYPLLRLRAARMLWGLGLGTMMFFSLFTTPRAEFWWSDLSLLAFVPLAALALVRLPRRVRGPAVVLALVVSAGALVGHLRAEDDYYPLDWGSPPEATIQAARARVANLMHRRKERDHVYLYQQWGARLPVLAGYARQLDDYENRVDQLRGGDAPVRDRAIRVRVPRERREDELVWVRAERTRLEGSLHGLRPNPEIAAPGRE